MRIQITSIRYFAIFILEISAFLSISFMEASIEGPNGGLFPKKGLDLFGMKVSIWGIITLPLLLTIPIIVRGFDSKLIGIIGMGYFIGAILEDFFWFVINPYFGIQKFNSQFVNWMSWIKIFSLEIPLFYIPYFSVALVLWFIFVKNSDKINNLYKKIIK